MSKDTAAPEIRAAARRAADSLPLLTAAQRDRLRCLLASSLPTARKKATAAT